MSTPVAAARMHIASSGTGCTEPFDVLISSARTNPTTAPAAPQATWLSRNSSTVV